MSQGHAIETHYRGYRFRSRLEARWAVFLDSVGLLWDYEREGYELKSGRYLPDFYLPAWDCWLEIKGATPTASELKLCEELGYATDKCVIMADGLPFAAPVDCTQHGERYAERLRVFCSDSTDGSGGEGWWDECYWALDTIGAVCICANNNWSSRTFSSPSWDGTCRFMMLNREIRGPLPERFTDAAKFARFEFSLPRHD